MRRILLFAVLLIVFPALGLGENNAPDKVYRVKDGKVIPFQNMIDDLRKASVVFVGELHDSPENHEAQYRIIEALHRADAPVAVGLEMFRAESQRKLDSWVKGKLSLDEFLPVYYDNWREPWPLYSDIFEYTREHEISMVGLNIPDSISKKIAEKGFGSLSRDEKKQLPPGISCNVDPKYREFIRRAYSGHHMGPSFENFCEAQMVWDKSMAWHVAGYLKKNPEKSMVVLAGIGHAWKRGISEQLPSDRQLSYRVVLPAIPGEIDQTTVTVADADYMLLLDL